jgi:hypothetical protein
MQIVLFLNRKDMKRIAEILHEHGLYANDCGKISGVDISV